LSKDPCRHKETWWNEEVVEAVREKKKVWTLEKIKIDRHDHYMCEWVNVSSGTGHPGCPGQNTESQKQLCVCTVINETISLNLSEIFSNKKVIQSVKIAFQFTNS